MNPAQPLLRHPASPRPPAVSLTVQVQLEPHDLVITYRVRGEVDLLNWPAPCGGGAADGLWQHTCFEAFIAREGERGYRELNLAPSGRWAHYAFIDERVRDPQAVRHAAPLIDRRETAQGLDLVAVLGRSALPRGPWVLGLSAVLEDRHGHLSHWALRHPKDKPDFHDRAGWTLRLPDD